MANLLVMSRSLAMDIGSIGLMWFEGSGSSASAVVVAATLKSVRSVMTIFSGQHRFDASGREAGLKLTGPLDRRSRGPG
jgi:hypothetical protein